MLISCLLLSKLLRPASSEVFLLESGTCKEGDEEQDITHHEAHGVRFIIRTLALLEVTVDDDYSIHHVQGCHHFDDLASGIGNLFVLVELDQHNESEVEAVVRESLEHEEGSNFLGGEFEDGHQNADDCVED